MKTSQIWGYIWKPNLIKLIGTKKISIQNELFQDPVKWSFLKQRILKVARERGDSQTTKVGLYRSVQILWFSKEQDDKFKVMKERKCQLRTLHPTMKMLSFRNKGEYSQ